MKRPITFLKEVIAELRKVVWPTRRRTARLTVIVVIVTIAFSAFLAVIDLGLGKGLEYVIDTTQPEDQPADGQQAPLEGQPGGLPPGLPQDQSQPQQPTQ